MKVNTLYISYDGLSDPLGQSQIIPYLKQLSKTGYSITIISFEKTQRKNELINIKSSLEQQNIKWKPLWYTKNPPVLSTLFDIYKLLKLVKNIYKTENIKIVHCRSYISAFGGLLLKKKYGVKFIFDIRGFWVDERVDGGLWNLKNPFYKLIYNYYKKKEQQFLQAADSIISLTKAGKTEMLTWDYLKNKNDNITIIPCAADFNHFKFSNENRSLYRSKLNIEEKIKVVLYLGSIGTWYLLDEMLDFFKVFINSFPDSHFLMLSNEIESLIIDKVITKSINPENVSVLHCKREEVPNYISVADFGISFIKPAYSKISSSPTKVGEMLAMGIPFIVNSGIGDLDEFINKTNTGIIIPKLNQTEYENAIIDIEKLLQISKEEIRKKAFDIYDLEKNANLYIDIYNSLVE